MLSSDDCDDSEPTVYEGADEVCDELDNNCDGLVDDDDSALTTLATWFFDSDEDGYGTDRTQSKPVSSQMVIVNFSRL